VAIALRCECGHEFATGRENAERPALCPACGREVIVPQGSLPPDGAHSPSHDDRPSRTSRKATASLILGLCAFVAGFGTTGIPVVILIAFCVAGLPAIIFGTLGLRDIKSANMPVMGKGNAIAGIVLGSLTTILTMLTPLVVEGRESSRRAICTNNLKEIAIAMWNYESAFGTFPPAATFDKDGKPLLSWRVLLLPYLEQGELYKRFHLDEAWDSPHNKPLVDKMPRVFQCPSAEFKPGLTTYEVIIDPRSMFTGERSGVALGDVTDGSNRTLLVVEGATPISWTKPADLSLASSEPAPGMGSKHPGGFNVATADGAVRFVRMSGKDAISRSDLRAMVTRNGNEDVAAP
jgi:prepilin-type processing-associated H-X9-DG protein